MVIAGGVSMKPGVLRLPVALVSVCKAMPFGLNPSGPCGHAATDECLWLIGWDSCGPAGRRLRAEFGDDEEAYLSFKREQYGVRDMVDQRICQILGLAVGASVEEVLAAITALKLKAEASGQSATAATRRAGSGAGATDDAVLRAEFARLSPAQQHEYFDEADTFIAYRRAQAAGRIGRPGQKRQPANATKVGKAPVFVGAAERARWRAEFESSPALRAEFGDDVDAFVAFREHDLAGDVTILAPGAPSAA